MAHPIDGVFMYIDSCSFGTTEQSRDVFRPYVRKFTFFGITSTVLGL